MASIVDCTRRPHSLLSDLGYLPGITIRDGRAIEEALAPATLLDDGARLDGAIIEASYAFKRPNQLPGPNPGGQTGTNPDPTRVATEPSDAVVLHSGPISLRVPAPCSLRCAGTGSYAYPDRSPLRDSL